MCMIRLGLGGVLVVCEDFYNLDSLFCLHLLLSISFLKLQPPYIHFFFKELSSYTSVRPMSSYTSVCPMSSYTSVRPMSSYTVCTPYVYLH